MRSKAVQDILNSISIEQNEEFEREYLEMEAYHRWMEENGMKYCTDTSPSLIELEKHGFYPVAITSFYLEETFMFRTKKEANEAYKKMEKELGEVVGWWYSEKDFQKELEESMKEGLYKNGHPKICRLDEKNR